MNRHFIVAIIGLLLFCNQSISQTVSKPDDRGFVVKVGDMAPDFPIVFPDKKESVKLSDLRGTVVLLQFTASWCGVCIKEMPHLEKDIWQAFKEKGLQIYGVDRKESQDKVMKFAKRMKITYPLIMDENGAIFELFADKNAGVTRNVLVDKEGKIVFLTRLFEEQEFKGLIQKINSLL